MLACHIRKLIDRTKESLRATDLDSSAGDGGGANGALTAAFGYLANSAGHDTRPPLFGGNGKFSSRSQGGIVLRFDESNLVQSLDRLPNEYRTAYAAACAQRLLPRYTAFYARLRDKYQEEEQVAEKYLSFLWRKLSERRLDHERIEAMIKRLLATLPDEDTTPAAKEPYCTDAGAAVVFFTSESPNRSNHICDYGGPSRLSRVGYFRNK
jgi:hypothetical protein